MTGLCAMTQFGKHDVSHPAHGRFNVIRDAAHLLVESLRFVRVHPRLSKVDVIIVSTSTTSTSLPSGKSVGTSIDETAVASGGFERLVHALQCSASFPATPDGRPRRWTAPVPREPCSRRAQR